MVKWCLVMMLMFGALGLPACLGERVTGEQARTFVKEGAYLLDVRTPGEYTEGHIDGAVNIPVGELDGRLGELPAKDTAIVVYCKSGVRSSNARKLLEEKGYTRVHDLGAMSRW